MVRRAARAQRFVASGRHAQWFAPGEKPEVIARADQGFVALAGPEFPDFVAFSYVAHFVEVRVNPAHSAARASRGSSVSSIAAG